MTANTTLPRILSALAGIGGLMPAIASAVDLRQQFLAEYPAAVKRLEQPIEHIRMSVRRRSYSNGDKVGASLPVEYVREGICYRLTETFASPVPDQPEPMRVQIGYGNRYSTLSKKGGIDKWNGPGTYVPLDQRRNSTGPHPRDRTTLQPLFAPTCADAVRVADYLQQSGTSVGAATKTTLDGQNVVEIDAMDQTNGAPNRYRFFFLPSSWALVGWDADLTIAETKAKPTAVNKGSAPAGPTRFSTHGRATYDRDVEAPKLKTFERWTLVPERGNAKLAHVRYEVDSIEFDPIPREEFSIANYGLIDPLYDPARGWRWWWGLLINGPLCVALGVWLVRRYTAWKRA